MAPQRHHFGHHHDTGAYSGEHMLRSEPALRRLQIDDGSEASRIEYIAGSAWNIVIERGRYFAAQATTPAAIGIMMAIAGNLMIACSLVLQKYVHVSLQKIPEPKRPKAHTRPLFWLAMFGLVFGEVGNFAAFGLASPTVVSPLGAVCVIANSIISAIVLKEQFTVRNSVGLLLTVCGAFVVVVNAPPTIEHLTIERFLGLLMARCAAAAAAAARRGAIRGAQFAELRRALRRTARRSSSFSSSARASPRSSCSSAAGTARRSCS